MNNSFILQSFNISPIDIYYFYLLIMASIYFSTKSKTQTPSDLDNSQYE